MDESFDKIAAKNLCVKDLSKIMFKGFFPRMEFTFEHCDASLLEDGLSCLGPTELADYLKETTISI